MIEVEKKEIKKIKTFLFMTSKGGCGKTLCSCLFADKLLSIGKFVNIVDVDANQVAQKWVNKCKDLGRVVSYPLTLKNSLNPNQNIADIRIVDTPGILGSYLPYLKKNDKDNLFIIIVGRSAESDFEVNEELYKDSDLDGFRDRVYFLVNSYSDSSETQKEYFEKLKKLVSDYDNVSHILSPIKYR